MNDPLIEKLGELSKTPLPDDLDAGKLFQVALARRRRNRFRLAGLVCAVILAAAGSAYAVATAGTSSHNSNPPEAAHTAPSLAQHAPNPRLRMNPDPCDTMAAGGILINGAPHSSDTVGVSRSASLTISVGEPTLPIWKAEDITVALAPWNATNARSAGAVSTEAIRTWRAAADATGAVSASITWSAPDGTPIPAGTYAMAVTWTSTYTGSVASCDQTDSSGTILEVHLN